MSQLTDTVAIDFTYRFSGSKATELTTAYSIKAEVQANYPLQGNTDQQSNVWQKDYPLVKRTISTTTGNTVSLDPRVEIPYAEYRQAVSDLRSSLVLPINSQVVVRLNVQVSGTADGTPFTDTRISTVSLPLEDQIYQPTLKFDKEDKKQVIPEAGKQNNERTARLLLIGGGLATLAGIVLAVYGLRKRIFKSSYQRELDKIYRYHDGILIRTSKPIDLAEHKVVPVRSFDDMLNLEEELKTPIIADEISSTLTHFLIAHHNVMYLYKLQEGRASGRTEPAQTPAVPVPDAPAPHVALERVRTYGLNDVLKPGTNKPQPKPQPKRPLSTHTKHPAADQEIDSIIDELSKKPTGKKK